MKESIMRELTIGIDIGGTNTKYGIVDREGNVIYQGSISTVQYEEFKDYFGGLAAALREAIKTIPGSHKLMGVGVGAANGNYYKIRFTSLTKNGERGYPSFEFDLVKKATS